MGAGRRAFPHEIRVRETPQPLPASARMSPWRTLDALSCRICRATTQRGNRCQLVFFGEGSGGGASAQGRVRAVDAAGGGHGALCGYEPDRDAGRLGSGLGCEGADAAGASAGAVVVAAPTQKERRGQGRRCLPVPFAFRLLLPGRRRRQCPLRPGARGRRRPRATRALLDASRVAARLRRARNLSHSRFAHPRPRVGCKTHSARRLATSAAMAGEAVRAVAIFSAAFRSRPHRRRSDTKQPASCEGQCRRGPRGGAASP